MSPVVVVVVVVLWALPCFLWAFNFIVCHPTCKHYSHLSLIPKHRLWKAVLCSAEGLSCDTAGMVNPSSCSSITCLWIIFLVHITENLVSSVVLILKVHRYISPSFWCKWCSDSFSVSSKLAIKRLVFVLT